MNYATLKRHDIANGPGVRVSLFVSGCRHHCRGCFNPETWDFNYGKPFTGEVLDKLLRACNHDFIEGLSVLGGEPFEPENQPDVLRVMKKTKPSGATPVTILRRIFWQASWAPGKSQKKFWILPIFWWTGNSIWRKKI